MAEKFKKMVYLPQKQFVPDSSFEQLDRKEPFLQFRLWLKSCFLYIWLEILFIQQRFLGYVSSCEYQQERKKKTYQTLVTYIDAEVKETQERCMQKCEMWRKIRLNTIAKVGNVAERVKVLNDDTVAFQTVCKGISMGAKLSMFGGPLIMLVGAGASILANIGYNQCSKRQIEELEKMCAEVQSTLQRDSEETKKFFCILSEMKQISEPARVCIRKFHSATVDGFFDNVPMFKPFANSVKAIKNVGDPESITDFIKVLLRETANLKRNASFRSSFSTFLTCSPEVVELINQIPKIICSAAVLYSVVNGVKGGSCFPCGSILKALNILAMVKDFNDIIGQLDKFDKYPQLSRDLKSIESKLEKEMDEICGMAVKMQQCTEYKEDFQAEDFCLEDLCQNHTDFEDYDPGNPFCLDDSDLDDTFHKEHSCFEDFYQENSSSEDSDREDDYQSNLDWDLDSDLRDSDLLSGTPEDCSFYCDY